VRLIDPVTGPFLLEMVDYKLRVFSDGFYARQDPQSGPGWYVFGRSKEDVIKLVARPDVPDRAHPHYNIKVRRGWRLKREAFVIAAYLNSTYRGWVPPEAEHHKAAKDLHLALEETHRQMADLWASMTKLQQANFPNYFATEQVAHHTLDKYKELK
jgi:hypothetical protein